MICPSGNYKEYAEKYGINLEPIECTECGDEVNFVKPVAMKKYRGLEAEDCKNCGYNSKAIRVVPVDEETTSLWNSLKALLNE